MRRGPLGPPAAVGLVTLLALPALVPSAAAQEPVPPEPCIGCHRALDEERLSEPALSYPKDVHAARGFGCLTCHGPDRPGASVLDPAAGFLAKPTRRQIPALCGSCHSDGVFMRDYNPSLRVDQVQEYLTSEHGRRLMEDDDPAVATCVSCHPAHRILSPSDAESSVHPLAVADLCGGCHSDSLVMGPRGIPIDQVSEYRASVHATLLYEESDLSAPTCNDCHGNHGAAPPGLASVRNVCGQCHATMADYFRDSGHVEPFDASDRPGCATCHGNHDIREPDDRLLQVTSEEVCADCHADPDDPHGDELRAIGRMIDSLEAEAERARALLLEAENRGMEVSTALFELEDVGNALTKARSAIHSFHVDPVREEVRAGLAITAAAGGRGVDALEEHRFRRVGLALSVSIILVIIAALLLRIRALDQLRRAASAADHDTEGSVRP